MPRPSTSATRLAALVLATASASAAPAHYAQDFVFSLTADDGQGTSYILAFGFSPVTTDGYDPGFDSYAPPAPPTPSFDAALGWGVPMDRYYTQLLLGDGDFAPHLYEVQLQYDTNQLIHISWDATGWAERVSTCVLRDAFGGGLLDIDMLTESELTLSNTAHTLLHLELTPSPWSPGTDTFCHGDPCPCGNPTNDGSGCGNGSGSGALLWASGSVSLTAGDLLLTADGLIPSQPGLYFQGNNAINGGLGSYFGDGLRCAGGGVRRLQVVFADASGASQTSIHLPTSGAVSAGEIKHYQLWYRDPALSPCGAGFNLSNGLRVAWEA
jgi:hypothetical protein